MRIVELFYHNVARFTLSSGERWGARVANGWLGQIRTAIPAADGDILPGDDSLSREYVTL